MSPEAIAHTMEEYVDNLTLQMRIAEDFYEGKLEEAFTGLVQLSPEVRGKIDQIIWEASEGKPLDPTEKSSHQIVAEAILYSLEERMGF